MQGQLLENGKIIPAIVPIDTTGAGQDGDWVNLKNFRRCLVHIQQGAWAGGTPAVTFEQATDAAGAGAKALAYTKRYNGVALTQDVVTEVAVVSSTSNLAAVANSFMQVEFYVTDLDTNNGFTYVRVRVASPGSNADLVSAVYVLGDWGRASKPSTLPSAIT